MSEGKQWVASSRSIAWKGDPQVAASCNFWMPYWLTTTERIEQRRRLAAWLNHIAPDGVIPPAPGGDTDGH